MTKHRSTRVDRILPELFAELADARTPAYLEAAIERASSRPQRPSWTYPGRWLPMDISARLGPTAPLPLRQLGVLILITILLAATVAMYVGSQQQRLPDPFSTARNGVIAVGKDGDIFVADRPGGDLRPLVAGPESDDNPTFSPDGTRLAFVRATELGPVLMVADANGTNAVQLSRVPMDMSTWIFAPDGRSLMTEGTFNFASRIVIRSVDPTATPTVLNLRLLDASMHRSWAKPTFNPANANEILVVARLEPDAPDGGGLYVYDLATGGIRTIVEPADEQYFQDIDWLPDGEHITYRNPEPHIVAADGSGDRVFDALRGRVSPLSNDGNRIVAHQGGATERSVIVSITGDGEPLWLTCNLTTPSCPQDWIWSPDDSMLIGITYDEVSSSGEDGLTETYLLVDADTGQMTELDWRDVGTPAWQRVAP